MPKQIGVIGKTTLNNEEKVLIEYLGRCIAKLGHTLVYIPAKGTSDRMREGVESEGGATLKIDAGVLEHSSHTLIFPDRRLLSRLRAAYPDIGDCDTVSIISSDQLGPWVDAVVQVLEEKEIDPPTR